ncbi:MAG: hypothetical protein JOZ73_12860 [Solirubrobacterales bacterium]|nr:hypothetical protein [Solirubrobacterales bacterium]
MNRDRSDAEPEAEARAAHQARKRPIRTSFAGRSRVRPHRRLPWDIGLLEYFLLALISLSIAVTVAMAILNP